MQMQNASDIHALHNLVTGSGVMANMELGECSKVLFPSPPLPSLPLPSSLLPSFRFRFSKV